MVLDYLHTMSEKTLLQISRKLCMLFLLLSAQRCQILDSVMTTDIKIIRDKVYIAPSGLLKQSRPGTHLDPSFSKVCERRQTLHIYDNFQLFVSYQVFKDK